VTRATKATPEKLERLLPFPGQRVTPAIRGHKVFREFKAKLGQRVTPGKLEQLDQRAIRETRAIQD
jgi:hypothetical protein